MALLGALGCSSAPPADVPIHLILDTESVGSGCTSASCSDYLMSCGATVSIRLTDPDSGEQLYRESGQALMVCQDAPVSDTICSLKDLKQDLQLFDMPARTVRVEVAVWNREDLDADDCEKTINFDLFDALGRPKTNFRPQPAFAGAAYFRAGEETEITVPLACSNPMALNKNDCAANLPTDVEAFVTDMGTMQLIREEQALDIPVTVGETEVVSDNLGVPFSVLVTADAHTLVHVPDSVPPVYRASIPQRFGDRGKLACSTTREDSAQVTTTVLCEVVGDKTEELTLSPVLIRKPTVDAILTAALGTSAFPANGLVIGRVVDEGFSPTPGVAVTPSEGTVLYLNDDLSDVTPTLSSASAYFVATDVPAGASWTASHFDGRRHAGAPRGGLIQGKLSAVIIRMTGGVIGPQD